MKLFLFIIAGPLFLISFAAYLYVEKRFRPPDAEIETIYHEFEDQHPDYARYQKWSKLTFASACLAALLLFAAAFL
jgi:hypothetical protein